MTSTVLPRSLRRRLHRQSDRICADAIRRLQGTVAPIDAASLVVIASGGNIILLHFERAREVLTALGVPKLLDEIAAARPSRHPYDVPLVICVDDSYVCCAWVRVVPLSAGGDA